MGGVNTGTLSIARLRYRASHALQDVMGQREWHSLPLETQMKMIYKVGGAWLRMMPEEERECYGS